MDNDVSPKIEKLVWKLAKLTLAFGLLGLIVLYTPIFELIYYFLYMVMIPLSALALVGFISTEMLEVFELAADELKWSIREQRDKMMNQASA